MRLAPSPCLGLEPWLLRTELFPSSPQAKARPGLGSLPPVTLGWGWGHSLPPPCHFWLGPGLGLVPASPAPLQLVAPLQARARARYGGGGCGGGHGHGGSTGRVQPLVTPPPLFALLPPFLSSSLAPSPPHQLLLRGGTPAPGSNVRPRRQWRDEASATGLAPPLRPQSPLLWWGSAMWGRMRIALHSSHPAPPLPPRSKGGGDQGQSQGPLAPQSPLSWRHSAMCLWLYRSL